MQNLRESRRIPIANYAGPRCFAPRARAALRGLGYDLIAATTRGRFDDITWKPALRIVDERHLQRIPSPAIDRTPVLLLTGLRPLAIEDPRIAGRLQRPAELVPLYSLIQEALEDHPRRTPRVATQLSARCVHADRRMVGAVVSLSEHGCLFRTSEELVEGTQMNLQFAIPHVGLVSTRAECVRRQDRAAGLVFSGTNRDTRRSISHFVTERLAAL